MGKKLRVCNRSRQAVFTGDEDGQDDVEQDAAAAQDAEQNPQSTNQSRVNVEILCDPPQTPASILPDSIRYNLFFMRSTFLS